MGELCFGLVLAAAGAFVAWAAYNAGYANGARAGYTAALRRRGE